MFINNSNIIVWSVPYFVGHLSDHSQPFRLNELDFQGPSFSDISQRQAGTNGRVPIQIGCHCHLEIDRATWRGFIDQLKHCELPRTKSPAKFFVECPPRGEKLP